MSKKERPKWALNPNEALNGFTGSTSGQFQRKLKTTSCCVTLSHELTGISITGQIPTGNYSKKEMQQLRASLYIKLFSDLERQVGKKLKIAGF
jgi:hypothetical protein